MSNEIKHLQEVFGVKSIDKNGNTKSSKSWSFHCSKGKSKSQKKTSETNRSPYLFPISRNSSGGTMSSKKFTFKPPASVAPRPHLSVASVPSVVSQGNINCNVLCTSIFGLR